MIRLTRRRGKRACADAGRRCAMAQDACDTVRFSDVGWTDITATTAATTVVLEALGYETEHPRAVGAGDLYLAGKGDIDVFLGNWMPTMEADIAPYRDAGTVDTVRANLKGAKYTLATNAHGAAMGIADFADIAGRATIWKRQIYGIEPGNDGNRLILDMIAADAFGLGRRISRRRKLGTGHAGAGRPRGGPGRADRVPGLGTASDERQFRPDLPDGRRRLVRSRSGWRDGLHQHPRGLCRGLPECGAIAAPISNSRWPWKTRSWARS
jgi:hypothetical protein